MAAAAGVGAGMSMVMGMGRTSAREVAGAKGAGAAKRMAAADPTEWRAVGSMWSFFADVGILWFHKSPACVYFFKLLLQLLAVHGTCLGCLRCVQLEP